MKLFFPCVLALLLSLLHTWSSSLLAAGPVPVEVKEQSGKWELVRDGKPYFILGGGGGGSKSVLKEVGGNSFRTWGIGPETQVELDEAEKLGLTVAVGIWLGHRQHGFRYDDPQAVAKQKEDVRKAVLKYKDHPAVLVWGLGNEMEVDNDSPQLWAAIQELAKMVHEIDPHHPTMTVVAEIGGDKVRKIQEQCPDIDIIGINTYGGGPSLARRFREGGGMKPYIVTEYGPPGTWETKANDFGAPPEMTSTAKAEKYRDVYRASIGGAKEICLGSYAFTWGHKIEATATWFGMFLPDGSRLAAVDAMQELWTGKPAANPCPSMVSLTLQGTGQVKGGESVEARVETHAFDGPVQIEWALFHEQGNYGVEGTGAKATAAYPDAIPKNGSKAVTVTLPNSGGVYRLYCYLRNGHGGAAVGSVPIKVQGPKTLVRAPQVKLPLKVLSDDQPAPPFIPSGWMGNAQAIGMEEDCTTNPHSGQHCLKVTFSKGDDWGSVAWQHPANDWGDLPGGYDVTGAESLTFWARGENGGEKVVFGYGMLGIEKKYHDSSKGDIEVTLTPDWKEYSISLEERELTRIKSGFIWRLAGQGKPVTFYLDDIEYR